MLAKAAPALEKLDRAQRRSRCVFLTGLRWDAVLPHAQASRQLAHLEVIELCHARLKGDFDEAQGPSDGRSASRAIYGRVALWFPNWSRSLLTG